MKKNISKLELLELERLHKLSTSSHWIAKDLSQALNKDEDITLIVELRNKAEQLIDMSKSFLWAEKWYAIRLQMLRDLCEKNNLLKEFCDIVANGSSDSLPPNDYMKIHSTMEYEIDKLKKENERLQSKLDELDLVNYIQEDK